MNPDGTVILNGDDDKLRGYTSERGIQPVYFGLDPACPFHAEQIQKMGLKGTVATFVTPSSSFSAHVSIPGDHMISNALAGVAVGYALGMKDEEIIRGIEKLVPIAGRNNLIEAEHYTIIDDCYNANPASMKSSLDVLAFADTRTVAILGDMGELGADEKKCMPKWEVMPLKRASAFSSASELFPQKWRMPPGQLLKHLLIPTPKLSYIILIQKKLFTGRWISF